MLHYPGTGWVFCHIEMEDLASAMFDDEEAIQNLKGECWNGKGIHGCDDLAMIAQEGSPEFPCLVRADRLRNDVIPF